MAENGDEGASAAEAAAGAGGKEPEEQLLSQAADVPDVYVNVAAATTSAYDVTVTFGLQGVGDEPTRPVVRIRMSLPHAKSVARLFERMIEKYEERLGTIKLPEDIEKRLAGEGPGDADSEEES